MTRLEFSDSVVVDVTPDELHAIMSDVTRMGEWSPEGGSEATGDIVAARTWETRSQVVAADAGREFAWEVNNGWVRWGFTVEPAGDGSRLTESWHFLPTGIAGFGERFGDQAQAEIQKRSAAALSGIPQTLAAIKATAEA